MPVLATAAVITALTVGRSSAPSRASFLRAESLRPGLERLPPSTSRDRALELADRLARSERAYADAAVTALRAYQAESSSGTATSASLTALLRDRDVAFERMIDEVIVVREEMRRLLRPNEWTTLFA